MSKYCIFLVFGKILHYCLTVCLDYLHLVQSLWDKCYHHQVCLWCGGVVVITTAQLHSTKPEFRFCPGSNPACDVSEICSGEDL